MSDYVEGYYKGRMDILKEQKEKEKVQMNALTSPWCEGYLAGRESAQREQKQKEQEMKYIYCVGVKNNSDKFSRAFNDYSEATDYYEFAKWTFLTARVRLWKVKVANAELLDWVEFEEEIPF